MCREFGFGKEKRRKEKGEEKRKEEGRVKKIIELENDGPLGDQTVNWLLMLGS